MKWIIAFLVVIMTASASDAQQKTGWAELGLKGKVKSLQTKETHRYKKNGIDFTPWENAYGYLTKFNSTGNRIEFNQYLGNDSLSYRISYTYRPKEKKVELAYFNKDLKPTVKKEYLYDDKGRQIDQLEYDLSGQLDRRYTYSYDARDNLLEMVGYKKDGKLSSRTTYQYDSKNNRTGYLIETPGYANSSRKFVYDDNGNQVEETWYNGQNAIDFRFTRIYDAHGNKIQEITYKGANDNPRSTTHWTYEYDARGNWTKKTDLTENGEPFHTETRIIVYY